MNLIRIAVPVLLALIGVEAFVAWRQRRPVYDSRDVIADVGCAVMSQVVGVLTGVLTLAAYRGTGEALALAGWPLHQWSLRSPLAWLAAFVLVDLMQYVTHRLSHRVNLLWACHQVHHSSREMNLAVGLRSTSFQSFFTTIFFLPGPFIGIPWQMVVTCYSMMMLYQFWLHTRLIGRLGPLETILNTPSHHRVHHGVDDRYLDRNYGGVLIVWDKWFGTFEEEHDEPRYGTVDQFQSWNPVWANVRGFADIVTTWRAANSWGERWRAVFGPPSALVHDDEPGPVPAPSPAVVRYAIVQLLVAVAMTISLVLPQQNPATLRLVGAAFVIVTLTAIGGLLDGRRWAWTTEFARLAALGLVVVARA